MKIKHIYEPTPLQCGQAVLSMMTGKAPEEIASFLSNERETTLKEMIYCLEHFGFTVEHKRVEVKNKNALPDCCFLSLETPKCWHWSLYVKGVFYDPEHGVLTDFPESKRKYYWEIKNQD